MPSSADDDLESPAQNRFPLILVVDDDQMNIEVMEQMLQSADFSCDTALSGQAALNLV